MRVCEYCHMVTCKWCGEDFCEDHFREHGPICEPICDEHDEEPE